jgi:hypothetical protein
MVAEAIAHLDGEEGYLRLPCPRDPGACIMETEGQMEDIRKMLEDYADNFTPFVIHTRGGRKYSVPEPHHFWLTPALPDCVVVVPPHKGLHAIRLDAIDSIASEVEKASR